MKKGNSATNFTPTPSRLIAHVDMDAFYAAVEAMDQPELAGLPLVVGGLGPRSVVSAASYEARAFGVRSAMPMGQALRLCPTAVVRPVRMARYRQVSGQVMDALAAFSPLVEQVSVDEAFLDLGGCQRLWGPPRQAGLAIKAAVSRACGLSCSVGLAPARFLAKIASERDKPDGLTVVEDLEGFLRTIQLREVSGVGKKAQERLAALGLKRLVELRPLRPELLERLFGSGGARMARLAWGDDPTPIEPRRPVKSLSHELTLDRDTADRELLAALLLDLGHKVARRLRDKGLAGQSLTLKLKTSDMAIVTRSTALSAPTNDGGRIVATARGLLAAYPGHGPFRLIGVGLGRLSPAGAGQGELFDAGRQKALALARAEDEVRRRFGERAIQRAAQTPSLDHDEKLVHNDE